MLRAVRLAGCCVLIGLSPLVANAHDGHGAADLGVKVQELANSSDQWDGKPLPAYPSGQPVVKVLRIQIPAGVSLPWHTHPVINAAVVLRGTLALQLKDGTSRVFQQGEAIIEVIDTAHTGRAVGDDDVDVVVMYAGVAGSPTTELIDAPGRR